ncbi:MAG: hypothetical protein VKJ46_07955 [Leptolyngbyaceae bacterium]|nr:hypothetical protein [Leptolyngbyaceae bacterium]
MEAFFSFLLSTLGVAFGVVAKSFWDRLMEKQEEIARLKRNKKLEILERQLSEFYWPLYLRLEKDNGSWNKVFDDGKGNLSLDIKRKLETGFILPNHDAIMEILETKMHLARAHKELLDEILKYIKHVALYKAIRGAGILDKDPYNFGEPFPSQLFQLLQAEKDQLQQEYDRILDLERK